MPLMRHRPTPGGRSFLKPPPRRHLPLPRWACLSCALLLISLDSTARFSAGNDPHTPIAITPGALIAPTSAPASMPVAAHTGLDLAYPLPHPEETRVSLCAQGTAVGITLSQGAVLQWPAHLGGVALVRGPARTVGDRLRLAGRVHALLPALTREGPVTARVAWRVQSLLCASPAMPHATLPLPKVG